VAQPDFCFGWGTTIAIARNLCWGADNRGVKAPRDRDAEGVEASASRRKRMGSWCRKRILEYLELEKTHLMGDGHKSVIF